MHGQGAQWLVDGLPGLAPLAQWLCAAYLLWLAWQLARAPVEGRALQAAQAVPPWRAFAQGATVQVLNPKAWLVALSGVGLFVLPQGEGSGAALAMGIIKAAVACHRDMATFAQAGVAGKA